MSVSRKVVVPHMILRSFIVAVLAWLVPGLGHLALGRYAKAGYFATLILGMFALGVAVGEGASVSSSRFPAHVYGQYCAYLPAWISEHFWGSAHQAMTVARLELGVVFTTVAGILNVVVVVDAYETSRGEKQTESTAEKVA